MNDETRFLSLLGLAARARELVTGEELVLKDIRKNTVEIVLLSSDVSQGTKKKVMDKCTFYHIPVYETYPREVIGRAIGKEERVVIGVKSKGFAKKLVALLSE
ncbi:YlxQ family RNA-binding protein [Shouchella lonarensis]|uniref:LSU ribosomal protein L7AE n=1 Tax=Shouchella lonarensis TaxID=1464122 RepID=A0A1G6H7S6_9BACI|nr:YlxQ family RNA-binding protein [Shouchella lonarensis]SDB90271.1 LSU ribosomal protein L7AE [Shouchella lonarensis]